MFDCFKEDIRQLLQIQSGGRRGKSVKGQVAALLSPGMQAVAVYRFGHWLLQRPIWLRAPLAVPYWLAALYVHVCWGIDIRRRARIGPGLYVGHSGGITIGSGAVLGRRVALSQDVVIGIAGHADRRGSPVIGDDVYLAPGVKVFGKIRVGNNVKIGANAVIAKDVPDNAVVALAPGFVVLSMRGNHRVEETAEQPGHSPAAL